ncbi:transcription termination factor 4, mitochondrial [Parambassis ranga]|uniref:Transcription termination factor 4, mitochondrial n=1 Tax=Parambassis ranga TaxID=210632 RepID=A0A6P7K414_9TELE|nr:transcription termination factor 4, mitochondrial [Parambassis ranga]
MGARSAARQILRWTVRHTTSSVFSPLQFERCHHPALCRLLCSTITHSTVQSLDRDPEHAHLSEKPASELSLSSLTDMGFTATQAEQLYEAVSSIRGRAAKHALSTLTVLFVLGLNPTSMMKVLEKCPELYTIKETQLQERINNLRKLGLVEGSLHRMVAHYPQILTLPVKTIKKGVTFFREKCLFTVQQVTNILRDSPAVMMEDHDQLEYKFQYVYFRMGVKQAEMVKCKLFRFTLDEVRYRHIFLERRGLYETPDKKGQTHIINPKLENILNANQETFLTYVARATAEEYEVFKKLVARELLQQEVQPGRIVADSEDEDEDDDDYDDDDDDNESRGKSGYMKRRKK